LGTLLEIVLKLLLVLKMTVANKWLKWTTEVAWEIKPISLEQVSSSIH